MTGDSGVRPRSYFTLDSWSVSQQQVQLTSVAGDKVLPDVVVSGIPASVTIIRAVAFLRFRVVENTFAGANSLSGAQAIQVRKAAGAYVNAISFVASMFTFTAATREGGLIIEGDINLATATVDGNATYNFQWDEAVAAQNNLQFNDVQVGIKVYFISNG